MVDSATLLRLAHVIGLTLAIGGATAKVALLVASRTDERLTSGYLAVAKFLTREIISGIVLLVLSGIGFLLIGYGLTRALIVKLALVAAVLVIGPVIDNVAEPAYRALASAPGAPPSAAFAAARRRYVTLELAATLLFYVIVVFWMIGG